MEGIFAHAGEKWHHLGLPDLLEAFLGEPPTRLMGMYTGAATVANSVELPQKLRTGLLCDPGIPLLGIYADTIRIQKHTCTLYSQKHHSQ